ncbi:MAG TPA: hypothetical protein VHQ47_04620 [Phycisphaerae bacterium]|jgi:hypothetical protein|nr:hypothetical protein [Phycisphaerae bacterium]
MRQHLTVTTDPNGLPIAEVPFSCMWELVEYLSYQRVAVTYQYQASHFTVSFPRQDAAATQRLLDDWANAPAEMLQPA